jgi:hypothetical protein
MGNVRFAGLPLLILMRLRRKPVSAIEYFRILFRTELTNLLLQAAEKLFRLGDV